MESKDLYSLPAYSLPAYCFIKHNPRNNKRTKHKK